MEKWLIAAAVVLLLTGCATKNYGRQGKLTEYEKTNLTCREIDIEEARARGFLAQVDKESQFDGRSVRSFLADFGIGNLMEKDNAVKSANDRLAALADLKSTRNCQTASAISESDPPAAK